MGKLFLLLNYKIEKANEMGIKAIPLAFLMSINFHE